MTMYKTEVLIIEPERISDKVEQHVGPFEANV